jgi:hypothetical protein
VKVHLTFDVEVWCDGWSDLDERFPAAFERYYYGRSQAGSYALPKTLEMMGRHGIGGVFFVEPMFSARFGAQYLSTVVGIIADAGQEVQLHLHPEWTDEIRPAVLADVSRKRQHMVHYDVSEQTLLIAFGRRLLEEALGRAITVFRAGSFAANRDTYRALAQNGIWLDSSLNSAFDYSAGTIPEAGSFGSHRVIEGVRCYPVTVYRDGLGRLRPAQVNGSSFDELKRALIDADRHGVQHFVIVSHNFEMLKPGSSQPDMIVVRRFEALCRFLADHRDRFNVGSFADDRFSLAAESRPRVPAWSTAGRLAEQLLRRIL